MTTWTKDQATAALRQCVLNVVSLLDGTDAPVTTSLTGKVFIRLGDESFVAVSGTLTNMRKPLVVADDLVDGVDTTDNELDIAAHGLLTGDGPIRFTTSVSLPAPLAIATDYWIIKRTDGAISLAGTLADALADVEIDLTTAGSGVHTLVDTASTERAIPGRWLYEATLAEAGATTNEVEVAVIDTTYHAQTLVRIATLSETADAVWDAVLESPHTASDLMRLLVSFAAGKVQNFSTGTLAFRNLADTVTRFTIVRSALGRISSTINSLLP